MLVSNGITHSVLQRTSTLSPSSIFKVGPGYCPFMNIMSLSKPSGDPFSHVKVTGKTTVFSQSTPSEFLYVAKADDAREMTDRPKETKEHLMLKKRMKHYTLSDR